MFCNLEFMDYDYRFIRRPLGTNKNVNNGVNPSNKSLPKKRPSPSSIDSRHHSANKRKSFPRRNWHSVMSGELQIVFIYDTLSVRKEEDDPRDAILYFHPDCIPEERRIAICGQLMGITHFLVDTFSAPKILTLDNGKFAMRKFGRQYILALGCSSVTPDWLLEKQADILYNLTIFFHRDIKSILQSVNGDRLVLASRLSLIMDHYIPISQHHGDLFALTFGILPILNLPKSASNISLSAAVVLQTCLMKQGVLGGIVMYQNKVLSVELMQELAQKLSFIQPYQLPPAEPARLQFACPPGVQLFTVYLREDEFENLRKHCTTYQNPHRCEPKIMTTKEANNKGKIDPISEEDPSDISSSLGFSEPSSKELSEDIAELENTSSTDSSLNKSESSSGKTAATVNHPKLDKFLKGSKGQTDSQGFHADSSQSKPVATIKKVFNKGNQLVAVPPPCVHMNGCGPNALKSSRIFKSLENLSVSDDSTTDKPSPPPPGSCFCASLTDPYFPFIRCDGKSISKALLDVYANAGVDESKQNEDDKENETDIEPVPPQETNNEDILEQAPKSLPSLSLPNGSLNLHVDVSSEKKQNCTQELVNSDDVVGSVSTPAPRRPADLPLNSKKYSRKKSKRRWSTFEDMMSPVVDTPSRVSESFPAVLPNINENWKNSTAEVTDGSIPSHQELFSSFRKLSSHDELLNNSSQTIPTDYPPDNTMKPNGSMMKNIVSNSRTPSMTGKNSSHSREMSAIGFGSISQQNMSGSSNNKDPAQLLDLENASHHSKSTTNANNMNYRNHVKSSLFIYGLGSMRLLLLLEKDRGSNHELIKSLWECGSSSLSELETAISNVEEQTMSTTASQHDHYCYLHYESVWRSLAHGGRNHSMDFDVVQQMHQDFNVYPNISELIIRGEDHVVYGYQCVGSEVFYQQSAGLQPGLPMPSDLMGKVPLKAKKRLERDHNILLL